MENHSLRNYIVISGIVFYCLLLFILGRLLSGYDPISQSMSELGAVDSPYRFYMNYIGFSFLGIIFVIFAISYSLYFPKNSVNTLVSIMVFLSGISMFLVGFFPCDAGCIDVTNIGRLHSLTSTIPAVLLPSAAMISSSKIHENFENNIISPLSFFLGLLSVSSGIFVMFENFENFSGLIQRLGIGLSLIWIILICYFMENKKFIAMDINS